MQPTNVRIVTENKKGVAGGFAALDAQGDVVDASGVKVKGGSGVTLGTTSTTAKRGDYTPTWGEVTSKPSLFPPDKSGITKADVGLGNVNNTDDMSKPVSTLQQQALDDLEATFPNALSQLSGTTTTAQVAPGTLMRARWTGTAWPVSPAGGRTDISIFWIDELGTSTTPPIVADRGDVYLKKV